MCWFAGILDRPLAEEFTPIIIDGVRIVEGRYVFDEETMKILSPSSQSAEQLEAELLIRGLSIVGSRDDLKRWVMVRIAALDTAQVCTHSGTCMQCGHCKARQAESEHGLSLCL